MTGANDLSTGLRIASPQQKPPSPSLNRISPPLQPVFCPLLGTKRLLRFLPPDCSTIVCGNLCWTDLGCAWLVHATGPVGNCPVLVILTITLVFKAVKSEKATLVGTYPSGPGVEEADLPLKSNSSCRGSSLVVFGPWGQTRWQLRYRVLR